VNRKDVSGKHIFAGGFLGLDNIRRLRSLAPAPHGRPAGASRRHGVDGLLLHHHAGDGDGARRVRSRVRGSGLQSSSSTSCTSPTRSTRSAARACGTSKTASTTTSLSTGSKELPLRGALDGRPDPALRRRGAGAGEDRASQGVQETHAVVPGAQEKISRARSPTWSTRSAPRTRAASSPSPRASAWTRCCATFFDETSSLTVRRPLALAEPPRPSFVLENRAPEYSRGYVPASRIRRYSVEIRTWRGPIWFPVNYL